jgi:hypothetical protein
MWLRDGRLLFIIAVIAIIWACGRPRSLGLTVRTPFKFFAPEGLESLACSMWKGAFVILATLETA